MKSVQIITGLCRVEANHARRNLNVHAAFTGFTGFAGFPAHVCVMRFFPMMQSIKITLPRAHDNNHANPVNPVTGHVNQGLQRIRVGIKPCTTLIKVHAMSKKSLREQMPAVTAFIDQLREVFGKEMIDGQIRKGMRGEPVFWASENGHEVGTPIHTAKDRT